MIDFRSGCWLITVNLILLVVKLQFFVVLPTAVHLTVIVEFSLLVVDSITVIPHILPAVF